MACPHDIVGMLDRIDGVSLVFFFFFSIRYLPTWNASTPIRKIAYQSDIVQDIQDIQDIAYESRLSCSMCKAINARAMGDIPWSLGSILAVFECLDESGDATQQEGLLRVFADAASIMMLPRLLRLLIVSYRERYFLDGFQKFSMRREELRVDSETPRADVAIFVRT